jgi:hypothetical protein
MNPCFTVVDSYESFENSVRTYYIESIRPEYQALIGKYYPVVYDCVNEVAFS